MGGSRALPVGAILQGREGVISGLVLCLGILLVWGEALGTPATYRKRAPG